MALSARPLALLPLIVLIGACATAPDEKLAVCDGRHRRPANPQGSVLAQRPISAPAAAEPPAPGFSAPGASLAHPVRGMGGCGERP
jgi:hypothetical protein